MSISTLWTEFKTWWEGTAFGQEADAAVKAAEAELEALTPSALLAIVESTSAAILPGITGGGATAAIISDGIAAAEAAFKAQSAQVASTTISTFVSTLHSSITAQQAAGAVTPAVS
jgi:hypothetical protein